ncbi:MAG TPA: hypothetical protein VM658_19010 [bacterium]|nr:hypothetical protein [bacterium]
MRGNELLNICTDSRDAASDRGIAMILLGAGLLGYGALAWFFRVVTPDGFTYIELAENLFRGGYVVMGEPYAKFLPFYPFLMALFNLAAGGAIGVEKWGQAVSVGCGAMLPPLLFLLARRLQASRWAALTAAAALALMAVGWDQYRDVNVMPIFTLLLLLSYWLLSTERFFTAGLMLGLAMITRYEGYLLVLVFVIANLGSGRAVIKGLAGTALAASPWLIRNLLTYGTLSRTSYWLELVVLHLHLAEIGLGLVKDFGPVALAAAALGLARLQRKWLIYLAGFAALYTGLHVIWWWYQDRFLLALMPAVLAPAALGLDRFVKWDASRRPEREPRMKTAAAAGVLVPLLAVSGLYLYGLAALPGDPILEAAKSLRQVPGEEAVLGQNPLIFKYTTGREAYTWGEIKPGDDPDRFVLEQVLTHDVGLIVWLNISQVDWQRFGFLKSAKNRDTVVTTPQGKFRLTYLFLRAFNRDGRIALVYRVMAASIE